MSAEPSGYPQWDEGDVNTTEPTTEKTSGWSPSSLPSVEHANWFQRLVYLWIKFLNLVRFRWSDLGPDWHVPDATTLPSTGAGLVGTSGAQVAYVQGRRVDGVSEAHTFAASTDTYIDLSRDAGWVYSQVANGAGAPALAGNSIRCFKVVTDGSDRTSVTSFVGTQVQTSKSWLFGRTLELGADLLGSAANAAIARIASKYRNNADAKYSLILESGPSTGTASALRLYALVPASGDHRSIVLTINAQWVPASSEWAPDSADAISSKWVFGQPGTTGDVGITQFQVIASGSTFADDAWAAGPAPWFPGGIRIGDDQGDEDARLELDIGSDRTLIATFGTAGGRIVRLYQSETGTAAFGRCLEIAENCAWDGAAWDRDESGRATKTEIGAGGLRILTFDAALTATWDDTVTGSTWVATYVVSNPAADLELGEHVKFTTSSDDLEILAGRSAGTEGSGTIHLRGTSNKLAKLCEGQNGLVKLTGVSFFTGGLISAGDGVEVTVVVAPSQGSIALGDWVVGVRPNDGTFWSVGVELQGVTVSGTNNVKAKMVNRSDSDASWTLVLDLLILRN